MLKSWVVSSMKYVNLSILRLIIYLNARLVLSIQCIIMAKDYVIMLKRGVILLNQYVVLFNCVVLFPKIYACDIVWTKRHASLT